MHSSIAHKGSSNSIDLLPARPTCRPAPEEASGGSLSSPNHQPARCSQAMSTRVSSSAGLHVFPSAMTSTQLAQS